MTAKILSTTQPERNFTATQECDPFTGALYTTLRANTSTDKMH